MYQLRQIDISEVEMNDPFWEDDVKSLPDGSFILVREVKKALAGHDFHYFRRGDAVAEELPNFSDGELDYYFSVFHYSEEFGLPNGKGWHNELSSTIQLLTHMKYIKRSIEQYYQRQAPASPAGSVDPNNFVGR
jgi:hypothetical protein